MRNENSIVMNIDFWVIVVVAVLLLVCGALILMGRGDWLISGYNTASEEKRARYNLFRLRLVAGLFCILVGIVMLVGYYVENERLISYVVLPAALLYIILSLTWVRRK